MASETQLYCLSQSALKAVIGKVDLERYPELASRFSIRGIPVSRSLPAVAPQCSKAAWSTIRRWGLGYRQRLLQSGKRSFAKRYFFLVRSPRTAAALRLPTLRKSFSSIRPKISSSLATSPVHPV